MKIKLICVLIIRTYNRHLNFTMPFPNRGENHISGVKNEKEICKYMNENPENQINQHLSKIYGSKVKQWIHEGGTKQKKDASVLFESGLIKGISIKNHKNGGTFDWINTTKLVPELLKKEIKEFKEENIDADIPKKGGIRDNLNEIFSNYLDTISSNDIAKILDSMYRKEENTNYIIINDKKSKRLILLNESNLDPYGNSKHGHQFSLKTNYALTSRQIWIKSSDGHEINTQLRIRCLLNNGITALLGKSTSNKSSDPCLKIQQDNVDEFINNCFGKAIVSY
jgi:hypothetical protein